VTKCKTYNALSEEVSEKGQHSLSSMVVFIYNKESLKSFESCHVLSVSLLIHLILQIFVYP
jgi:hypothetical protein